MKGDERWRWEKEKHTQRMKKSWLIWDELNMSVIPNSKLPPIDAMGCPINRVYNFNQIKKIQ